MHALSPVHVSCTETISCNGIMIFGDIACPASIVKVSHCMHYIQLLLTRKLKRNQKDVVMKKYVSGFEKRGHFAHVIFELTHVFNLLAFIQIWSHDSKI